MKTAEEWQDTHSGHTFAEFNAPSNLDADFIRRIQQDAAVNWLKRAAKIVNEQACRAQSGAVANAAETTCVLIHDLIAEAKGGNQ